jgi:hypothetical protein
MNPKFLHFSTGSLGQDPYIIVDCNGTKYKYDFPEQLLAKSIFTYGQRAPNKALQKLKLLTDKNLIKYTNISKPPTPPTPKTIDCLTPPSNTTKLSLPPYKKEQKTLDFV